MIRDARRADLPAILRMMDELNAYSHLPQGALNRTHVRESIFGKAKFLFADIAEIDAEAVGYALSHDAFTTDTGERAMYMVDLYVHADARGSGAGIGLMNAVARRARARGASHLWWVSMTHNWRARRFYARLGASDDKVHMHVLEGAAFQRLAARGRRTKG